MSRPASLPFFLFVAFAFSVQTDLLVGEAADNRQRDDSVLSSAVETPLRVPASIRKTLTTHCADCHTDDGVEAALPLDTFERLDGDSQTGLLQKIQEQVFFGMMPPAGEETLDERDREALLTWLGSELSARNASALQEKLDRPEFGNYVDHQKLFSGDYEHLPGFTFDRRWLISEFIFDAKVNHWIDHPQHRTIDGVRRNVIGDNGVGLGTRFGGQSLRQRITNPFLLPSRIGVRYYSHESLTGGHLLTMISNAKKIAGHITLEGTVRKHYPAMVRIMEGEFRHRQTLRVREQFLSQHMEAVLKDIFGEQHADMLPEFSRAQVEEPPPHVDREGNPIKKTNLGLLRRYDRQDLDAIWLGLNSYGKRATDNTQVIEQCERDWFYAGVHPKRIANRIAIMKVLHQHWDRELIDADVRKRNLRHPKYRPLGPAEMAVIGKTIRLHRRNGDNYRQILDKCLSHWRGEFAAERAAAGALDDTMLAEMVQELSRKILERELTARELTESIDLLHAYVAKLPIQAAITKLAESLLLRSELVYRYEFGQGVADEHGRRMMSPRDASYALAYALTDSSPDQALRRAAEEGRLKDREDYRREVSRMLARRDQYYVVDERVQKGNFNASITNQPIRKLRFFRELFGYPRAMDVFKDDARFGAGRHEQAVSRLIDEADLLVCHILERDERVFEQLLTTEDFYVFHSGDNAAMGAAAARQKEVYEYFRKFNWREFTEEQLFEHWPFIQKMQIRGTLFKNFLDDEKRKKGWTRTFQRQMEALDVSLGDGQASPVPYDIVNMHYRHPGNATGRTGQVMRGHEVTTYFNLDYRTWDYPVEQPAKVGNRMGMLTHPAWLIAHSLNTETDPVRRGKWIREKLLAGTVPDVPITVDAVIPEDPDRTLRQRLHQATSGDYCWKCHQKMDPLGLPLEIFDDFGRYRTEERLEHDSKLIAGHKAAPLVGGAQLAVYETLPIDTRGELSGTGDVTIDGPVRDAFDLVSRLARSDRVRQSLIRHAFRYFLGRNETLSDSKTLIAADHAYLDSNGSFDAVIVSLLTSDSFIYRKPIEKTKP